MFFANLRVAVGYITIIALFSLWLRVSKTNVNPLRNVSTWKSELSNGTTVTFPFVFAQH